MEPWSDDDRPGIKENERKLNRGEIIKQQQLIIKQWRPPSDMWALKYGNIALCTTSAVTSVYINSHFRRYLRLHKLLMSSTLAMAIAPTCINYLAHFGVHNRILTREYSCPACIEVGSSLAQATVSVGYAIMLSGALNLMAAAHEGVGVPGHNNWRGVLNFFQNALKPIRPALSAAVLFHAVLGGYIAYEKLSSMSLIDGALLKYYQDKLAARIDKAVEYN